MKVKCPACEKKFIDADHWKQHMAEAHPDYDRRDVGVKRKGWATPYGFVDFAEPVDYETACAVSEHANKSFAEILAKRNLKEEDPLS